MMMKATGWNSTRKPLRSLKAKRFQLTLKPPSICGTGIDPYCHASPLSPDKLHTVLRFDSTSKSTETVPIVLPFIEYQNRRQRGEDEPCKSGEASLATSPCFCGALDSMKT